MKTDPEALRAALIWAAGGKEEFPGHKVLEEEEFCRAVERHRLEVRLLDKLRSAMNMLPENWVERLNRRRRDIEQRVRSQADLCAHIGQELQRTDPEHDLIVLKGFELYAHSGLGKHLRYSGDVDIIGYDPELVACAALKAMGDGVDLLRLEHSHEYANLLAGQHQPNMQVADVHFRYNITGFRPLLDEQQYMPAGQQGKWMVEDRFSIRSITYSEMEEFAVHRQIGTVPVTVLSPELSVIIRCAHMYIDYLISPFPLPVGTIRLDELAAVTDLASLPGFDAGRFAAAIQRFDAQLVVAFARKLGMDLLGGDPFHGLPECSAEEGTAPEWFPGNLWWDGIDEGIPVNLGWFPRNLVVRAADYLDMTEFLGAAPVYIDTTGHARTTVLAGGSDEAGRIIYRARPGYHFDAAIEFTVGPEVLELEISLPATPADRMSAIAISSGEWRYELFFKPGGNHVEFKDYSVPAKLGDTCSADCSVIGSRQLMRLVFPWQALGREGPPTAADSMPFLFKAKQQDRNWGAVRGIMVAPVNLVASDSQIPRDDRV